MAKAYNVKVIRSGNVIEVYQYSDSRLYGYSKKPSNGAAPLDIIEELDEETGEIVTRKATEAEQMELRLSKQLSERARSNIRARNNLRRLVLNNFNNRSTFLTLTFQENLTDLTKANQVFKRFVKYMNEDLSKVWGNGFKYVAVVEFQKRGAIHYHLICDLPKYYRYSKVRDRWRQAITALGVKGTGSTKQHRIDKVDNVGAYVVKYMTKAGADERLIGKKLYQTSKGLKKPTEKAYSISSEADLNAMLSAFGVTESTKKVYHSSYIDSYTTGTVVYSEFNLKRGKQTKLCNSITAT